MRQIKRRKYKIKDNNLGFTFVELLVSFAVMTIAMLGIFSFIIQNIRVQRVNKDYLIASMLSQEGLEIVRSIRDQTWLEEPVPPALAPETWDYLVGLYSNDDFIVDPVNWRAEANVADVATITDDPVCRLNLPVAGVYQHGGAGTPTRFYRLIKIIPGPDLDNDGIADFTPDVDGDGVADYVNVISRVEWSSRGHIRSYITETLLYDWRQYEKNISKQSK